MKQLKNPILLALTIALIILLIDKCSNKPSEIINTKVETVYIKGKDSVYIDTVYKWKHIAAQYVPLDTQRMDLSDTNVFNDTFYYSRKDSSLDFTITVEANQKPKDVQIEYSVLQKDILKEVTRVDTIKETITNKVRVNQIYFGGSAVVYPSFNSVFAELDFISKKGYSIGVGAGIVNKTPALKVGFKKLITFRKK